MIEVLRLLHEISQDTSRRSGTYYVRHLYEHEPIPDLGHGIPDSPLAQRDWIWVAYKEPNDTPVAILIAAPMQGVAMLMRISAIKDAPNLCVGIILRKALADMYSRGYTKYGVFLNLKEPHAARLLSIARKAGAETIPGEFTLVYGSTDISKW